MLKTRSNTIRARYCCVLNCSSHTKYSNPTIDERTGKSVRLHAFPNPDNKKLTQEEKSRETDRLAKWVSFIGRSDVPSNDVKTKKICSLHFDFSAYNCPSDISASTLKAISVPTLVNGPHPPPATIPSQPLPTTRMSSPRTRNTRSLQKCVGLFSGSFVSSGSDATDITGPPISNTDTESKDLNSPHVYPVTCFESPLEILHVYETKGDLEDTCVSKEEEEPEAEGLGQDDDDHSLTPAVDAGDQGDAECDQSPQQHVAVQRHSVTNKYKKSNTSSRRTLRRKQTPYGPRAHHYCCALNCTNIRQKTVDPRTDRPIKFHCFPDPVKEADRCSQWITNLRNPRITLGNVKFRLVCAIHFEAKDYNNPTEISKSRLLPAAVPIPVDDCKSQSSSVSQRRLQRNKRSTSSTSSSTTAVRSEFNVSSIKIEVGDEPGCSVEQDLDTKGNDCGGDTGIDLDMQGNNSEDDAGIDLALSCVDQELESFASDNESNSVDDGAEISQEDPWEINKEDAELRLNQGKELPSNNQRSQAFTNNSVYCGPHSDCHKKLEALKLEFSKKVQILQYHLVTAENRLAKSRSDVKGYQATQKSLNKRLKRLQANNQKQQEKEHMLRTMLDQARKFNMNKFVEGLHTCCTRHEDQLNLAVQKGLVKVVDGEDENPLS